MTSERLKSKRYIQTQNISSITCKLSVKNIQPKQTKFANYMKTNCKSIDHDFNNYELRKLIKLIQESVIEWLGVKELGVIELF